MEWNFLSDTEKVSERSNQIIAFLFHTGIYDYVLSIYTQSLQNCLGHNLVKEKVY